MYYSVKDLREKLYEKLFGLGLNPEFKNNPAFGRVVDRIDSLMAQMNMFKAQEGVLVSDDGKTISFEWTSSVGEANTFVISAVGKNEIRCIKTSTKSEGYNKAFNKELIGKTIVEEVATLEPTGQLVLEEHGSLLYNTNVKPNACDNSAWSEKCLYDQYGVMINREYKGYKTGELTERIQLASPNSALYIAREAFKPGFWYDKYDTRTLLVRDSYDTARVVHEDKTRGIIYNAKTPLNNEHGYQNMVLLGGYDPYPTDTMILPKTEAEVDIELDRETDKKVVEGLRRYAKGREEYYYIAKEDPHFRCEGTDRKTL